MKNTTRTGLCACIAMFILIIDGKTALEGACQGLELCYRTVIPSLFPFIFLSVLLTSALAGAEHRPLRLLGRMFRVPAGCESILLFAFLGGYPAGAYSVKAAYDAGSLSRENAERMLPYCNNAGPAFIFGMAASLFPHKWMGWALWAIQICSIYAVSLTAPVVEQKSHVYTGKSYSVTDIMRSALGIMGQICGWVVLFGVILCFLNKWVLWLFPGAVRALITGLLELSNGCWSLRQIEGLPLRFILCSAMLAFGGICVSMQTASAASGLSLGPYFRGKVIQTLVSILLSAAVVFRVWWILPVVMTYFLINSYKSKNNCSIIKPIHV